MFWQINISMPNLPLFSPAKIHFQNLIEQFAQIIASLQLKAIFNIQNYLPP